MELIVLHHQENCFLFPGDSVPQVKPVASEPQRTRAIFPSSRHLKCPARIMSRKTSNVCVTAVPVPWIKLNGISRLEPGAPCEFRVSKSVRPGHPIPKVGIPPRESLLMLRRLASHPATSDRRGSPHPPPPAAREKARDRRPGESWPKPARSPQKSGSTSEPNSSLPTGPTP
jgi:hypothetical protein